MTGDLRQGFRLGEFSVHPPTGTLSGPGGTHHVSTASMDVLICLARQSGQLVSHEQLANEVWAGKTASDGALVKCISDLRHQLGDHTDNPRYIQTLPRRGYRLLAAVSTLDEATEESAVTHEQDSATFAQGSLREFIDELRRRRVIRVALVYLVAAWVIIQVAQTVFPALLLPDWAVSLVVILTVFGFPVALILAWAYQVDHEDADPRATGVQIVVDKSRKVDFFIITALVAMVVILAYELYVREAPGLAPATVDSELSAQEAKDVSARADTIPAGTGDMLTIAVLPFDNMTDDPANQNICDGIVEELLNQLVRIRELRVVGRKASFYYRDKQEQWKTIASTLGASMIIEGSVRRNDDRMVVAAQLVDRSGFHLWSKTYDQPTSSSLDILDIQRQIAKEVASALPISLSAKSQSEIKRIPTENDQAYQLYLQGRSYLRTADQMVEYQSAETLFRNALELDPSFVDALSGLCEAQLKLYQRELRPQDYAAAASTCSRLIADDELNTEGYVALGTLNRMSGNFDEAKVLFESALELSPSSEPALYGLARSVEGLGNYDDAEQYYIESERVDPGYWRVYIGYGRYLERGGDYAGAIEKYEHVLRLTPDNQEGFTNLGAAYFDNDQWDKAAEAWQTAIEIEADPIGYLNLGTAEYYRQNYELAAKHFRAGIYIWSEFYPLWGKLGATLERLGDTDESQSSFQNAAVYAEAAIEVNPKDSRAMYYLASYSAHLGHYDVAREWAEKAAEISPADPTVFYFTAIVESLGGDDDAAIDALAEALRLGYSAKIIQHDFYFQPYLNSAKLAEWMTWDE